MSTGINGFHLFTVKEYSRLKEMDAGICISSDTFTVGGYDWKVHFYPHGDNLITENSMYVSVFFSLMSDCKDVEASFEVTLLNQCGKGLHYVKSSTIRPYRHEQMWGLRRFIKKLDLESSDYLRDDSLTFCCMVRVIKSRIRPENFTIIPPPPGIEKDFMYLLNGEIGSDIVFRVKDVIFKAHKVILAARSPVFRAQFFGLVGNPNMDEVELEEIEPSIFKAMLMFIYSDTLPDSEELSSSMSMCTSTNLIQHLLAAADRFGLDRLKQLCEAKLCEKVNAYTVATTLCLADQHCCSQLKAICLKFTVANLGVVMRTEGYKYLEQTCPLLLSELLETVASVAVDERPCERGWGLRRKRSRCGVMGLNLAAAKKPPRKDTLGEDLRHCWMLHKSKEIKPNWIDYI